jgi:hypothetical protein
MSEHRGNKPNKLDCPYFLTISHYCSHINNEGKPITTSTCLYNDYPIEEGRKLMAECDRVKEFKAESDQSQTKQEQQDAEARGSLRTQGCLELE